MGQLRKPGRPNKLEELARQRQTDVASLVIDALNKRQKWELAGEDLGISRRTLERFADANLEFHCIWYRKGETPLIATMIDDDFSASFSIEPITDEGQQQPTNARGKQ